MVRRALDASIVSSAIIFALLSARGGWALTTCCGRRGGSLFAQASASFASRTCTSPWLDSCHDRSGNCSSSRSRWCSTVHHSSSTASPAGLRQLANPLGQRRARNGSLIAMSSSTGTLPLKRHCNTFLLTPPPPQEEADRDTAARLRGPGPGNGGGDGPLALIILNTTGDGESKELLRELWARAALRVCADGGANRLYDSFDADPPEDRARFVPDVIVGDLDSLRPEVAAYYKGLGAEVKVRADQDHNDFEKCLVEVEARLSAPPEDAGETEARDSDTSNACPATVVGLGAFGGRFDHEMAGMSLLHSYTSRFRRLVLMGAGNVAFLLEPGLSHVVEPDERFEGPTIGLIPIGGACRSVTTEGLKWNLEGGSLEFGVLVSSSNCVVAKEVRVTTDAPLVWTAEFKAAKWAEVISSSSIL